MNKKTTLYYLYLNTIDNTTVIVIDKVASLFEKVLINMGSCPILIETSEIVSDLQLRAIEYEMENNLNNSYES
jgi:hypothetical protein